MKRICVVLTTRGNHAKMKTAMAAIAAHPDLELQLVVGGALLNRQATVVDDIRRAGLSIAANLDYMQADETSEGIGKSAARCLSLATELLGRLRPDVLLVIADRYEALVLAMAALVLNIQIAHLEGGELSGSIDERIRHAITKLAHYHFPANAEAANRLHKLGERQDAISVVGSPSFDLLRDADQTGWVRLRDRISKISEIDISKPFLLVSQHPVVTEDKEAAAQFRVLAEAILRLELPSILIWPNNDAGAAAIREPLEWLSSQHGHPPLAIVPALPIEEYGAALQATVCLVGNSSSGIRESSFLGVPVVNIGTRQMLRARGANVVDVPPRLDDIVEAVRRQIAHGRCPPDLTYGDGRSGQKIANFLAAYSPSLNKTMAF